MLDSVDFISFHSYQPSTCIEAQTGSYRHWLAGLHRKSTPLWITESGWPREGLTDRPSCDQDRLSALEITSKAVEAKACGIARYFPFVFPDYREGKNNFGMMAKNGTPLRSFAAYAQCIRALANKSYLGDLKTDDPLIKRSRVFGDDRECVAVLYTGQINDVALKLPLLAERVEGIDGRILEQKTDGSVSIPDGLAYIFFKPPPTGSLLQRDTPAMGLNLAARGEQPAENQPHPMVIQNLPDLARNQFSGRAYDVSESQVEHYPLLLRVNNLSAEKLSVNITLDKPTADGAVHPVEGYGQSVEVNGNSFSKIPFKVDLRKFGTAPWIAIDVVGRAKSGALLDTLKIPFQVEENSAELLQKYSWKSRLPIEQIDSWQKNIASDGRMAMSAGTGKPWRLEVQFGSGDAWVYPVFKLPADLDLSKAIGLVIRARCERPAQTRLILKEKSGRQYFTPDGIIPSDGQWHAVTVQFTDLVPLLVVGSPTKPNDKLDLGQVREIMVGMNSSAQNNVLEVSDLYAVGRK